MANPQNIPRQILMDTAERVEKETGFHVCFRDYGDGLVMTVGNTGTSEWTEENMRFFLNGFMSGVKSERQRGDHD